MTKIKNRSDIELKAISANENNVRDLILCSLNTESIYNQAIKPTIETLRRHAKRNKYENDKALIAWIRCADACAMLYTKKYADPKGMNWNVIFSIADRCKLALELEKRETETVFYELEEA